MEYSCGMKIEHFQIARRQRLLPLLSVFLLFSLSPGCTLSFRIYTCLIYWKYCALLHSIFGSVEKLKMYVAHNSYLMILFFCFNWVIILLPWLGSWDIHCAWCVLGLSCIFVFSYCITCIVICVRSIFRSSLHLNERIKMSTILKCIPNFLWTLFSDVSPRSNTGWFTTNEHFCIKNEKILSDHESESGFLRFFFMQRCSQVVNHPV